MATDVKPALMHYVARDPTGPIKQARRSATQAVGSGSKTVSICSGENLRVPCQPNRSYLNRGIGKGRKFKLLELFMATAQLFIERQGPKGEAVRLELVTCPRCKASSLYKRDVAAYDGAAAQGV